MPRPSRPYDQNPDESRQAYAAFRAYCELGRDRSLPAVHRRCKKSISLLGRWSARYLWVKRAAAWDAEEYERVRLERIDADREERERERKLRRQMMQAMRSPVARAIKVVQEAAEAGEVSPRDLSALSGAVATLNRESRAEFNDEPVQHVAVGGQPGNPILTEQVGDYDFDSFRTVLARLVNGNGAHGDGSDGHDSAEPVHPAPPVAQAGTLPDRIRK